MQRAPRIARAQVVAVARPAPAVQVEWILAATALAIVLLGLL